MNQTNHRLIVMAGSTTTLLLALLASISLNVYPTRGLKRTALVIMSFYFLDSFFKTIAALGWLPLGLNSRFLRSFSEAHFAAIGLGVPPQLYTAAILISALLIVLLVALSFWRNRKLALE